MLALELLIWQTSVFPYLSKILLIVVRSFFSIITAIDGPFPEIEADKAPFSIDRRSDYNHIPLKKILKVHSRS